MTLTLALDWVIQHTVVLCSLTSIYVPNFIEIGQPFCGRMDVRIYWLTFQTPWCYQVQSARLVAVDLKIIGRTQNHTDEHLFICRIYINITQLLLLHYIHLTAFFQDIWVSRHQKVKPIWILLEQEMMRWQWHQLDHMEIICASLKTDNHASTSPLGYFTGWMPFLPPNQQCQTTEGKIYKY